MFRAESPSAAGRFPSEARRLDSFLRTFGRGPLFLIEDENPTARLNCEQLPLIELKASREVISSL
jgi:hypothetical protein